MSNNHYDLAEIRRALGYYVTEGAVTELRMLGPGRNIHSGFFTDLDIAAHAATQVSGKASGVYLTLNPVPNALLVHADQTLVKGPQRTTRDDDVLRRARLLVDFDAVRASSIPATDAEHAVAIDRARECQTYLQGQGWPTPLLVDSGNGAHLIFAIDLPNDADSLALVHHALAALDFRFSDALVKVDTTVANAARISRLPGTWSAKGEATSERPHRLAHILDAPDTLEVVTREQLGILAAMVPPAQPAPERLPTPAAPFHLEQWITEHNLPVVKQGAWQDGYRWVLNPCPWNAAHDNAAAYILQFANGAIAAGCHHQGCQGNDWRALRAMLDPQYAAIIAQASDEDDNPAHIPQGGRDTDAQALLALAAAARLFHTPDKTTYASIPIDGHHEIVEIGASQFDEWLNRQFYQARRKAPSRQAREDALGVLRAQALYDGPEERVYLRVAPYAGGIYFDLANSAREVVEINAQGWRVMTEPPVNFWRPNGMMPLPQPIAGGDLRELATFLNLPAQDGLELVVAWLVMAYSPTGPYPVLILTGEQGSAKSSTARMLRELIDPNAASLRHLSRSIHDLMITAKRSWVITFDNISSVGEWVSDALCCLATGGGMGVRALYTTDEECLFEASRPLMLNGIGGVGARADLLDRAIVLQLPRIDDAARRSESELSLAFGAAKPRLIGALCSAISTALAHIDTVTLDQMPRMADFARWIVAAEPALPWEPGRFMTAYEANRSIVKTIALEDSPLVDALLARLTLHPEWSGTATELLMELAGVGRESERLLPRTPKALSDELKRLAPSLRSMGIEIERERRAQSRQIRITRRKEVLP